MQYAQCQVCGDHDHRSAKCPTLTECLKPGFFTGGGAGGDHSHDDDDEHFKNYLYRISLNRLRHFSPEEIDFIFESTATSYTSMMQECNTSALYTDKSYNAKVIKACQLWRAVGELRYARSI